MNVSLYQAAAAMNANSRWQEIIAENLASSSIPGARKQDMSFSAVQAGLAQGVSSVNGGRYVMPTGTPAVNFQPGSLRATGQSTDVALEGPGFLEVQLPNGAHAFTRDGELHLSAQGQLVTKQGYVVMGDSGPLQFDLNNAAPVSISSAGDVSQAGEIKGRLKLSEFSQPQSLKPIGDGYFLAGDAQAQPAQARSTQLRQGFLEGANSSPTTEMASLINAMRSFEANQKVMQMQDERMGRAIQDLGNPS